MKSKKLAKGCLVLLAGMCLMTACRPSSPPTEKEASKESTSEKTVPVEKDEQKQEIKVNENLTESHYEEIVTSDVTYDIHGMTLEEAVEIFGEPNYIVQIHENGIEAYWESPIPGTDEYRSLTIQFTNNEATGKLSQNLEKR